MSLEGWIFMVGLRVFDVGGLIVWMIWFFRLRDDEDDANEDEGGGNKPRTPAPPGKDPRGGLPLPLPDAEPWPSRLREHGDRQRTPRPERRRTPAPVPVHERIR